MKGFHPIIQEWFRERFRGPTEVQTQGWASIQKGLDTLIAAPTGSGKTLTAFLVCINELLQDALEAKLEMGVRVVYVSPLKALSNDIQKNLETPLQEILELAESKGHRIEKIRTMLRTGDSTPSQRQALLRKPPHILVTTPESLFLLITSEKSREILRSVKTVIVDEIHSLARDKRGSHLVLTLERLDALCSRPSQRIGLSATQKPLEQISEFLVGFADKKARCQIIDTGHQRNLDLAIEVPPSELSAVCSNEQWEEIYTRLKVLIEEHRSTLIFVNTRKLAERVSYHLCQQLGEGAVASHHGSLSKEKRLSAEMKLRSGDLKAIVATASLELGIDIGYIDLVCQIGSPRNIAGFLQRVGRSGHSIGKTPKGRLFALTRDELLESIALIHAIREGKLDAIVIPTLPLDILAQHIVAAAVNEEWDDQSLYDLLRRAYPFKDLSFDQFLSVVKMLADGYGKHDKSLIYIHYDAIHRKIRARRNARLIVLTNSGAIPEQANYRVVNIDDGTFVGTVAEDFALERPAGHVFILGNTSWMIIHVRGTQVSVRDAHGAPPTVPFWVGEAPGRSLELSQALSELRCEIAEHIPEIDEKHPIYSYESIREIEKIQPDLYQNAVTWLCQKLGLSSWVAYQAVHYIAVQKAALGLIPSQEKVVFERFFDDTGGMQLVIHAPFGIRLNRAWGLALRKRFCRSFDFELQANADDDGIVLSLGPNQSFPIEQLFNFLTPENVQALLEQAFLQAPYFRARWQWNANRALAILRFRSGKRVAPALQKFRGDDLLTAVFPASTQCNEHITGDIEIPIQHPLVLETMLNCLYEAADLKGLMHVLHQIREKKIELIPRESREPSPFAYERLNANPYAFLDDAPIEERRTRALSQRRHLSLDTFDTLRELDPQAIEEVRQQLWPIVRSADELYETLQSLGLLRAEEAKDWKPYFEELCETGRACSFQREGETYFLSAERLSLVQAAYPEAKFFPTLNLSKDLLTEWTREDACQFLILGRLNLYPIQSKEEIAQALQFSASFVESHLLAIQSRGHILQGQFTKSGREEWCERRLLHRIHQITLEGLRKQIKPVSPEEFLHFLFSYHGLVRGRQKLGVQGLKEVLISLQGFETAAGAWEEEILPRRVSDFQTQYLDQLCYSGFVSWGRFHPLIREDESAKLGGMHKGVPLAFAVREHLPWLIPETRQSEGAMSANARKVFESLEREGALFPHEIRMHTHLLPSQLDEALGELARLGYANADGFSAIRNFISGSLKKRRERTPSFARKFLPHSTHQEGGRWSLFPGTLPNVEHESRLEAWAWLLLERYGLVFYDLLARESCAPKWSELVPIYRRWEARGEIRGGRFVSGVSGEQFALKEIIEELRAIRKQDRKDEWVVISAADPLNFVGILSKGSRVSSSRNTRLLFRDGILVASLDHKEFHFYQEDLTPSLRTAMERILTRI